MSVRRHFAGERGEPICGRVPAAVAQMAETPEQVTCVTCRSELARLDPRTRLRWDDVVTVGDDPTERKIGRYLTRGTSGRDYSRTTYTLYPLDSDATWDWVDWREVTLVRRGRSQRMPDVQR